MKSGKFTIMVFPGSQCSRMQSMKGIFSHYVTKLGEDIVM